MSELAGSVVATTGPVEPDDQLARALASEGARVVRWPTIAFMEPADPEPLRRALSRLGEFDWIVFTSPRAVDAARLGNAGPPERLRVAAVGGSTASRLRNAGWATHLVGRGGAAALAADMGSTHDLVGARVLFPAGALAGPQLEEALSRQGAVVERVEAYRTRIVRPDAEVVRTDLERGVRVVTFASPSAVRSLADGLGTRWKEVLTRCAVAAIGPTTRAALLECGAQPEQVFTARIPGPEGLVRAVVRAAATDRSHARESLRHDELPRRA